MKSVFKNPKLKAQQSRNAFDRGAKKVFHAPFGMLLPCFVAKVSPDDYIELSAENQCICEPLARPAFMRLKEHIDYFFIPYSQLYTPFENLVTAQDNYFSELIASHEQYNVPSTVPLFNGDFLREMLVLSKSYRDVHGFNKLYGALRLLDLLGYGNYYRDAANIISDPTNTLIDSAHLPRMNFFNLLAYQKIYFDYYRNPKYEKNTPSAYNIDTMTSSTVKTGSDVLEAFLPLFDVHYRWMKKDYFMSVQPSILPVSSNIGYQGLNTTYFEKEYNFDVPGIKQQANATYRIASVNNSDIGGSVTTPTNGNYQTPSGNTVQNVNSVAAIRLNFALDRIARRQREAGAQFDKQMLAQFGITPIDERHGKCVFIGGQTNRLYASDVTNQSETGESGLGSLGGQINVYSPNRRTFKYHAKEHGIVMGIYSTSLENDYPSSLISRDNTACGRFDWFNPGFDKIGLQPIFRHELSTISEVSTLIDPEPDPHDIAPIAEQTSILGYVRRFMEYKTNIDMIHGLFASKWLSPEDSAWTTKFKMTEYGSTAHKDLAPLNQTVMVYNPQTFDDVAQVAYDGTWRTDHFKLNHFTHCRVISNMDVIGEDF